MARTFLAMTSTAIPSPTTSETIGSGEHADLLETLAKHRSFLRFTARDLTDEQAATRSTVSQLSLGGLIKHVTAAEGQWVRFILEGPTAMPALTPDLFAERNRAFALQPGETLDGVLDAYERAARHTDQVIASLPDLGASQALPDAPWFEPGARWSARRVVLHVIAETSQHAGHADILREAIDGQKTMG